MLATPPGRAHEVEREGEVLEGVVLDPGEGPSISDDRQRADRVRLRRYRDQLREGA